MSDRLKKALILQSTTLVDGQKTVTAVSGSFQEEFRILLFEEFQKNFASLEQLRSCSSGSFLPLPCSMVTTVI